MNPTAPARFLSPLIDRDGAPIEGLSGQPLAADEHGIVYTLRADGPPEILGGLAGDEDGRVILIPMSGLAGRKRLGKKFLKRAALMAFTGGAAAPFVAASRTRAGKRASGRFLNGDGSDSMMAGDEMPVSTQVAGMGDIGSWWTKNREKVLGFGAGAASAALVASGASKGTGLNTLVNKGWDAAKGFFIPQSQGGAPAPAPMPVAMPSAMPLMRTRSAAPPMQMAQASIGGMDSKTLLLIGGLGLGALVLLRPKH